MYSRNIVENAARWVADYHSGTVLEAARCISDNRYLFRTSPAAENSGNRRRWNERASERASERMVARGTEASGKGCRGCDEEGAVIPGQARRGARKEASFPHRDSAPSLAPIPC